MRSTCAVTTAASQDRVSVALCTYNGAQYLSQQLDSLVAQTLQPAELVVCDDGSSDETLAIITEFARNSPFPVRLFRNESNLGSTKNFDRAIGLCDTDSIALCDQDDIWKPGKLAALQFALDRNPSLGGVFSDAELISADGAGRGQTLFTAHRLSLGIPESFSREAALKVLFKYDFVTGATLMIRSTMRPLFRPIPKSWVHDSWIAWIIALYSQLSFVNEPLMAYRVHPNQQIGMGVTTLIGKIRRTRHTSLSTHRGTSVRFQELRKRWKCQPGEDFTRLMSMIDAKIAFLEQRSALSRTLAPRMIQILRLARQYDQFARGYRSMRKDLFLAS